MTASKIRHGLDALAAALVGLGLLSFAFALFKYNAKEALLNEGFLLSLVLGALLLGVARIFQLVQEMNGNSQGRTGYQPYAAIQHPSTRLS